MRQLIILFIVGLAISVSSCREDFQFEPSTGDLTFSKDTVYLDTVFTNIGSSTYTLKVYNRSDKDIKIPTIQLGKGQASKYRMTVDGMTGENNRVFHNVELLAKDSMYIFIEVTTDVALANPTDFLYTDQIQFDSGDNFQKVELVTLIQDAYFLYPRRFDDGTTETIPIGDDEVYGFFLDENDPVNGNEYVWGNDKPYVVYGYAAVPNGKTLNVQPGARIHFHAESGLIVGNGGSLRVNGQLSTTEALENEVIFEGDRLEPDFSDVPGQWGTIWLSQGSTNNQITNCTIKNGVIGLYVTGNTNLLNPQPDLRLKNTQIYDCSNYGILSYTGYITGENVVINSAGQACFSGVYGGKYKFTHSTFNNNWSSSRQLAVFVSDYLKDALPTDNLPLDANFINCIIYGSNSNELIIEKKGTVFTNSFQNCLVKLNISSGSLALANPTLYDILRLEQNGNKINLNPKFKDANKNQLNLLESSAAIGFGVFVPTVPEDILGNVRTISNTDIGAYQYVP
jgi:hypothetical protein